MAAILASDHAWDVLVRKPGQTDTLVQALLLPWSDEGKAGGDMATPVVRSAAWFGLLAHDAWWRC